MAMKINSKVLAETLYTEAIQKKHCDIPPEVSIPPTALPAIEAKIQLYQFTSVLLALMATATTNPEFLPVQEHLERLLFPPTPEEGTDILLDVRGAMRDLSELLTTKEEDLTIPSSKAGKSIFWARDWLSCVGVEENNPVTLALFALKWIDYYTTIHDSLTEFDPVAEPIT
jgi:hypothetical protein